jgi:endoribonuclease Dicer
MSRSHSSSHEDVRQFLFETSVTPEDVAQVQGIVEGNLHKVLRIMNEKIERRSADPAPSSVHKKTKHTTLNDAERDQLMDSLAKTTHDPRSYQRILFERAKHENIIVHLGTGTGKTWIALLLLQHYVEQQRPMVFLVPSVALAVQQHAVLSVHLEQVQLACAYTLHRVAEETSSKVLVATHGAYLDLLRHYPDQYSLGQVSLMILDECHHCIGNSPYATILRDYYHTLPQNQRPRVLGLTASPLIAVKVNHTEEQLTQLLTQLEVQMDAKIVAPPADDEDSRYHEQECSEHCIPYRMDSGVSTSPLPRIPANSLHPARLKEFKQLEQLELDLGPLPVIWYCRSLQLKRNQYQNETREQFQAAQQYLERVAACRETHGTSHKLQCLEQLLEQELSRKKHAVGVVFVQRRITACALDQSFQHRNHQQKKNDLQQVRHDKFNGQFADAEDDNMSWEGLSPHQPLIRCCSMIRKSTGSQMFRAGAKLSQEEMNQQTQLMEEEENNIRKTLDGLRKGTFNVLVATSVVEEGVDLQACSFVIAFDALTTIKSYIQMKGRARQKSAKFYFFENDHVAGLNTKDASRLEKRIENAVANESRKQEENYRGSSSGLAFLDVTQNQELSTEELFVLRNGSYTAELGAVFLNSAKSLLYRFALSQPIDWVTRSSKRSLQSYLPFFDEQCNQLTLPAYCGAGNGLRSISLPETTLVMPKKDKQKMLALIACVRLHKNGLLSRRLLPFSRSELRQKILSFVKPRPNQNDVTTCYINILCMEGERMEETRKSFGNFGKSLALVCFEPLLEPKEMSVMHHDHPQFGRLACSMKKAAPIQCTKSQIALLREFFVVLFNARWKKRTKDGVFKLRESNESMITPSYVLGCIDDQHNLDWMYMQKIVDESKRNAAELKAAAQQVSKGQPFVRPRLWIPDHDPMSVFVVYGGGFQKDSEKVDDKNESIFCQYCWQLPITILHKDGSSCEAATHAEAFESSIPICPFLKGRMLPKSIFPEAPLADAAVYFEALLLPQSLYFLERIQTTRAFVEHCRKHIPILAQCLEENSTDAEIATLLTAASCAGEDNYERWEWFGDAVLQLVMTDVCFRSPHLRPWMRGFHEGDLDVIRSALCCNDRLEEACLMLSIDRFLFTSELARGQWTPRVMKLVFSESTSSKSSSKAPRGKILADVIEAILGLVYMRCGGYPAAVRVADELGLTIEWDPSISYTEAMNGSRSPPASLEQTISQGTGYIAFRTPALLLEAFTHPTCLDVHVAAYERLEWIGDAVLALAARLWIFDQYSDKEDGMSVGRMVTFEKQFVCNSTLAFLACRMGWHRHLRHHDATLPGRIEAYWASVSRESRGIWSTQPPKALADAVEAVLGAVFVDGGCAAGVQAAHELLRPFLETVIGNEDQIRHPQQELLELLGDMAKISVKLRDADEDEDDNGQDTFGLTAVATISLWGVPVLTCVADHPPAATHRACALLLSILEKDSSWMQQLQAIRNKQIGLPKKQVTESLKRQKQ